MVAKSKNFKIPEGIRPTDINLEPDLIAKILNSRSIQAI